jgi:hypothetical protein
VASRIEVGLSAHQAGEPGVSVFRRPIARMSNSGRISRVPTMPAESDVTAVAGKWFGPGVAGIGGASFLADLGHEIPTKVYGTAHEAKWAPGSPMPVPGRQRTRPWHRLQRTKSVPTPSHLASKSLTMGLSLPRRSGLSGSTSQSRWVA